jgi:hypothetical protein
MAPAWLKILLAVGLLVPFGFLVVVIVRGMRYDIRYERDRLRRRLSPRDRRIFWGWVFAFPIVIIIRCVAGIALHLGSDFIASELAGGAFAGGVMILLTWFWQGYLTKRSQATPPDEHPP